MRNRLFCPIGGMKPFLWLFLSMIVLASCELTPFESARNIHHIGIGISYRGTDLLVLEGPINDAVALKKSFHSFFSAEPFESTLLLQQGMRKAPIPSMKRIFLPKTSSSKRSFGHWGA